MLIHGLLHSYGLPHRIRGTLQRSVRADTYMQWSVHVELHKETLFLVAVLAELALTQVDPIGSTRISTCSF